MMKSINKCKLLNKTQLTRDVFSLTMENKNIAKTALPGQFLNVKCGDDRSIILRRPISINDVDRAKGTFTIVFRVVGKGTKILSEYERGEHLDIIGPLGNGYDISSANEDSKIAIVAGGMGVMPVLFLAKELKEYDVDIFLGYRDKDDLMLVNEYRKYSSNVYVATDDGSEGYSGFVTDLYKKHLNFNDYTHVYACGPKQMFLSLKNVLEDTQKNIDNCQISLEEKMGCGLGACLTCSCKIKVKNEDGFEYMRVCKDGPVFKLGEVIFE